MYLISINVPFSCLGQSQMSEVFLEQFKKTFDLKCDAGDNPVIFI